MPISSIQPERRRKDDVVIVGTHGGKAVLVGIRDFLRGVVGFGISVGRSL